MGLSASQARLLTLTTRLSRLELQSQSIASAKQRLSGASSEASNTYQAALNKQNLTVLSGAENGNAKYVPATASNLTNYDAYSNIDDVQRFLKDSSGQVVVGSQGAEAWAASGNGTDLAAFVNGMGYSMHDNETDEIKSRETSLLNKLKTQMATAAELVRDSSDHYEMSADTVNTISTAQYNKSCAKEAVGNISGGNTPDTSKVLEYLNAIQNSGLKGLTQDLSAAIYYATPPSDDQWVRSSMPKINAYSDSSVYSSLGVSSSSDVRNIAPSQELKYDLNGTYNGNDNWSYTTSINANSKAALQAKIETSINGILNKSSIASAMGSGYNDAACNSAIADTLTYYKNQAVKNGAGSPNIGTPAGGGDRINVSGNLNCDDDISASKILGYTVITDNTVEHNDQARKAVEGSTVLVCAESDSDDWWIDATQLVKYFLNKYDSYASDSGCVGTGGKMERLSSAAGKKSGVPTATRNSDGITLAQYKENLLAKVNDIFVGDSSDAAKNNKFKQDNSTFTPAVDITAALTAKLQEIQATLTQMQGDFINSSLREYLSGIDMGSLIASGADGFNSSELSSVTALVGTAAAYTGDYSQGSLKTKTLKGMIEDGTTSLGIDIIYDANGREYYTNVFNEINASGGCNKQDDANMEDSDWLYTQLSVGNMTLSILDKKTKESHLVSWETGDSTLSVDVDDTEIAKAEALYEATLSEISAKEKRFDTELNNIETSHNAIQTEIDSVEKVIDKNIERTFKMFNA